MIDRLAGCPPTPSKPPAVSTAAQSVAPAAATNIRRRHTGSPGRSAEPRAGAYSAPVGAQRAGACIALGQCTIPPFWCVMSPKCVLVVHFLYHSSLYYFWVIFCAFVPRLYISGYWPQRRGNACIPGNLVGVAAVRLLHTGGSIPCCWRLVGFARGGTHCAAEKAVAISDWRAVLKSLLSVASHGE